MPEIYTTCFGTLAYDEETILRFPAGLPGFPDQLHFLAIEQPVHKPLVFLQSLSRPELCFITLPVSVIDSGYRLAIGPEDLAALALATDRQPVLGKDVLCLAIISAAEHTAPTANLLSPVVINLQTRVALQAIQPDANGSHRHPLFDAVQGSQCS